MTRAAAAAEAPEGAVLVAQVEREAGAAGAVEGYGLLTALGPGTLEEDAFPWSLVIVLAGLMAVVLAGLAAWLWVPIR